MNCPHYIPFSKHGGSCALRKYGGRPSNSVCLKCIELGENKTEESETFAVSFRKIGCKECKPIVIHYPKNELGLK